MNPNSPTFKEEIESHKSAETVPDCVSRIETEKSLLQVRMRGCFITDCELTDALTNRRVKVLHCSSSLETGKLTASHTMMPVGPTEEIGGRHGFPRWADYHKFTASDGKNGEKRIAFQAKRSDTGLGLVKVFEMTEDTLCSETVATNYESNPIHTSIGEHLYFNLEDENIDGLLIDDHTLDEWLGDGAQEYIMEGHSIYWDAFGGDAVIDFPAGHSIDIKTSVDGAPQDTIGMLIWHGAGSNSICFEPTIGFNSSGKNDGIEIRQNETVTLSTEITLLPI